MIAQKIKHQGLLAWSACYLAVRGVLGTVLQLSLPPHIKDRKIDIRQVGTGTRALISETPFKFGMQDKNTVPTNLVTLTFRASSHEPSYWDKFRLGFI